MGLAERLNNKVKLNESQKEFILKKVREEVKRKTNFFNTSFVAKKDFKEKVYLLLTEIAEQVYPQSDFMIEDELIERSLSEIFGLGILERYLMKKDITDIFIQDREMIVIKEGKKISLGEVFTDSEVNVLIDKIKGYANKTIDQRIPFLNTELFDGSRCSVVIPPVSDKIYISIRVFNCLDFGLGDLLNAGMFGKKTYHLLTGLVKENRNVLIAGSMGSGKTTLLNTLAKLIPENEFISIIQDVPEIKLESHPYVRLLTTRPKSREIDNEINQERLVYETLRMKADRIIIGEIRNSVAAYQMLQALNTGHRGSFCTIHADSALDALLRLETLAMEYKENISENVVKRLVTRSIDNVIYLELERDEEFNIKNRRLKEIMEIGKKLDNRGEYKLNYLLQ
ncbi:MAG: CpaF family protein [Actinomycetota bacterium]